MNRVELLSPAGDLEKLKMAFLYGADAVYAGGKNFSLRARASNFTLDDIKEASFFAKSLNKKLYITMNVVAHEEDLNELTEYLKFLEDVGVTGIICSSMYIGNISKKVAPKLEVHISTQTSTLNSEAVKYYAANGATRVVLGREATLDEIKMISKNIEGITSNVYPYKQVEIECFIHGGMCSSFSGRCMLSNYLTNRDANRGGCAHSCRWNYDLYEVGGEEKLNKECFFNIGSKDLNAITIVKDLIEANVSSLKIEGRMKSLYYIATITRAYRNLIDDYYDNKEIDYEYYSNEIAKAENRLTSTGFLKANPEITKDEELFNVRTELPTKDFLGIVLDYDKDTQICTLEQRNYFKGFENVEFFGPKLKNTFFTLGEIYDVDGNVIEVANHPLETIKFKVPFELKKYDMMRKF